MIGITNVTNPSGAPPFLYKYRAISKENEDFIKRIFTHCEVYFASVIDFNDPFDSKHNYTFDASQRRVSKYINKIVRDNMPKHSRVERKRREKSISAKLQLNDPSIRDAINNSCLDIIFKLGIFCLTEVPDDILMWSHYANGHKGFCLQFANDDRNLFMGQAQRINYSEQYPVINPVIDTDQKRLEKALLTKSIHWSYEKEWRIIDYKNGVGVKSFPKSVLTAIIFGSKMSDLHKNLIKEWCINSKLQVRFYKAVEAEKTYKLELSEVS